MKRTEALVLVLLVSSSLISCEERKIKDEKKPEKPPKPEVAPVHEVEEHEVVTNHKKPIFTFPLFPSISFPTFPQLHFPQLTALPHFNQIPQAFKKETATKTKTVFVETTVRVTRHPICVTVYGNKSPCLDNYHRDMEKYIEEQISEAQKFDISPTQIPSSPVVPTRPIGRIIDSELGGEIEPSVEMEDLTSRMGRYIVPHPGPMFFPYSEIRSGPEYDSETATVVEGLLKATQYVTKTLHVTKVENIIDHQVTATLVAKNCIPTDPRLPTCGPLHPHPKGRDYIEDDFPIDY